MLGVYNRAEDRAGRVELIAQRRFQNVFHWQVEFLDGKLRSRIQANQHAARFDKSSKRGDSFVADSACVFFRVRTCAIARDDLLHALIGQNENVEFISEIARAHVRIVDVFAIEAELLKHPARPSFIHRRRPASINCEARFDQRLCRRRQISRVNELRLGNGGSSFFP